VMKKIFNFVYSGICLLLLVYLLLPSPSMPGSLPDSVKSNEPGDMEDPMRIAFYTDMNRQEVVAYYLGEFGNGLPALRLRDYPPEEAQTLIRDQTQSTFLEELVHPMRESLFINGYEPSETKNPLVVNNKVWKQKITIKFVQSSALLRLLVGVSGLVILYLLIIEFKRLLRGVIKH